MTTLTGKDERKLLLAAKRLFSVKSLFFQKSISDNPIKKCFVRELRLTGNRTAFLTDSGYEHFRAVVDVLDRTDFFDGMAEFSDIWNVGRLLWPTSRSPQPTDERRLHLK